MTKTWNSRILLVSVLLLMLVVVTPVAATSIIVDLDKTYQYKATNVSHIIALDMGDPSVSTVEILSTGLNNAGDSNDVRIIQQPSINTITRIFDNQSATFKGITVTLDGDKTTTINYQSPPTTRYYIAPVVPTFKITAPGYYGNPMVAQVNESLQKADVRKSSPILATNMSSLYNMSILGKGIVHYDAKGVKTAWGTFIDEAPFDQNNLDFTLTNNRVNLNSFVGDSGTAWDLGDNHENTKAVAGKYFAGAISHDEDEQTTTVIAGAPFIVLKQETPIVWTDDYGTHSLPMTYVKGEMGDVNLKFPNADIATTPTKIGYVLVNSQAQYNIQATVNTTKLADNAEARWDSLLPSGQVIDILYDSIRFDVGLPYTYNITAVGQTNAPDATSYTQIAITPGYGMSGNMTANNVTIPEDDFKQINDGTYYVYLMGVNDNNDVVAFAQSTVIVKSGNVADPVSPTLSSLNQTTGTRNTTVYFTLTGNNFPADLGVSGVNLSLTLAGNPTIYTTVTSVAKTRITGSFDIVKANVNGAYDLVLYTDDAGQTIKTKAFTITDTPKPTISLVTPSPTWYRCQTVSYEITGKGFDTGTHAGLSNTVVTFQAKDGTILNASPLVINSGVYLVTPTKIYGRIVVPWATPATKFNIGVTTPDGKTNWKTPGFGVETMGAPKLTTVTPSSSPTNLTVSFTLAGNNFQPGETNVTFENGFSGTKYYGAVNSVSGTGNTKLAGTLVLPADAIPGAYDVIVTTSLGGTVTKEGGFTVTFLDTPKISSINQTSGFKNSTVYFLIKGKYFQSTGTTSVYLLDALSGSRLNATVTSVSATDINGRFVIPADADSGSYDLYVTTADGGRDRKMNGFTIKWAVGPTVTSINQTTGFRNSTVNFMVIGKNFQPGASGTFMRLYTPLGTSIPATLTSVTDTKITGTFTIPYDANTGKYRVDVLTVSGGSGSKQNAYTVNKIPAPKISSVTPSLAYQNQTFTMTVKGENFQTNGGTNVTLTAPSTTKYYMSMINVEAKQLNGTFKIPMGEPIAKGWILTIQTVEGGSVVKTTGFDVASNPAPTFTSIAPSTVYKNTTAAFTITGKNFQTEGSEATNLTFRNTSNGLTLVPTIFYIDSTTIIGSVFLDPANPAAKGTMNVNISTVNGHAVKPNAGLKIAAMPTAEFTSISPATGMHSTTVPFTLVGKNFLPRHGTRVIFYNGATEAEATITSTYQTRVIGSVTLPAVPTGDWNIRIITADAGLKNFEKKFKVL